VNPTEAQEPLSGSTVTLVVRRTIRASAQRLFDAWTRPEHLLRWWGPRNVKCVEAQIDLRVGGSYCLGNQLPDGSLLWIRGVFEQVLPPTRLDYTWTLAPALHPPERVRVRFEPRATASGPEVTDVIVQHEHITSTALRDQHEMGWQGCLDKLEQFLA